MGIEHGQAGESYAGHPLWRAGGDAGPQELSVHRCARGPEERKRCKVDGLAWLTWIPGKLPGYNGDVRDLMPAAMPKAEEEVKTAQI